MEEAPSPALDERLRKKMAAAAVSLAKQAGYQSLGTVEFLLDHQKHFYFMEMNTRIQVEHPVTEEITGIDLVELQFNIAAGRKLPLRQSQIHLNGWSIECRINAEDVQAGFSPSIGVIRQLRLPQGNHIRIETGIAPGSEITPFFDSMVAKLIVTGDTREQAIERTLSALERFHVKGIRTTIPFCKAVLHNVTVISTPPSLKPASIRRSGANRTKNCSQLYSPCIPTHTKILLKSVPTHKSTPGY